MSDTYKGLSLGLDGSVLQDKKLVLDDVTPMTVTKLEDSETNGKNPPTPPIQTQTPQRQFVMPPKSLTFCDITLRKRDTPADQPKPKSKGLAAQFSSSMSHQIIDLGVSRLNQYRKEFILNKYNL